MTRGTPHAGRAIATAGAAPEGARLGLVLLHGRGGSAADILGLAQALEMDDVAAAAPEADGQSWWPTSFLAPHAQLEPWLGSALDATGRAVALLEAGGLGRDRIVIAGFSQGACLALEYAIRVGGPWAGVAGLSGGLVGTGDAGRTPEPALYGHAPKAFDYCHRLDGVPVYLGCHDSDPHIPRARVTQSAAILRNLGADVTAQLHPGAGHGITQGDFAAFRQIMAQAGV